MIPVKNGFFGRRTGRTDSSGRCEWGGSARTVALGDGADDAAGVADREHLGRNVPETTLPAPVALRVPMRAPGQRMAPPPTRTTLPMKIR